MARHPAKLLIFEPYPMGQVGGNLRTLAYLLEHLDCARFEPLVVAPMRTEFMERISAAGIPTRIVEPPASVGRYAGQVLRDTLWRRARNALDLLRYNFTIARLIRREGVDVVYCNSIRALLTAGLGAKLARRPVLWYIKGALENALLDRLGFALADRILFFAAANRDDRYPRLVRWYRRKIGILKIGIDRQVIDDVLARSHEGLRAELGISRDRLNIIILGQVYRPKGVHVVLERFQELVAEHPEVMLWIVGDHVLEEYRPYRDELERIVARDGLENHVRFTGWRRDALDILCEMDIVAHPSFAEGFGRAVLESMALGKPVVASKVGGLREAIIDGENGFLVEPRDGPTFLDRLRRFAGDPALRARLGERARQTVLADYLIEDKIIQFQQELAGLVS